MANNVEATGDLKRGNVHLERGGQYATRAGRGVRQGPRHHEAPDQWLDREMQDLFVTWKAREGEGPYASRQIADVAHGIRHPHRIIARRMREAHAEHVAHDRVRKLGRILIEYADRLYRRTLNLDPAA